jgi:hypothetical protein
VNPIGGSGGFFVNVSQSPWPLAHAARHQSGVFNRNTNQNPMIHG